MVLTLGILVLAAGAVQAASRQAVLRVSLTIVDRCDVRGVDSRARVDCSPGVPWLLVPAAATNASSSAPRVAATGVRPSDLPVPRQTDGVPVTTIVF
jgi:hypothetical protein